MSTAFLRRRLPTPPPPPPPTPGGNNYYLDIIRLNLLLRALSTE
jgi:hypothetical protein